MLYIVIYCIQKERGELHKRRKVITMKEELTLALALIRERITELTDTELEQLIDSALDEQLVRTLDYEDESGFNPYIGEYDFDC